MMRLFTKIPGKHYFLSILIVGCVLFVTFSTILYRHYEDARQLNEWTLYNYKLVRQARRILQDLVDMETGVRGYTITGRAHFLEPYESSKVTIIEEIQLLREFTKNDASTQDTIDVWVKKIDAYAATLHSEVVLLKMYGASGLQQRELENQKSLMDDLRVLLEGYIQTRVDNLQQQIINSEKEQRRFKHTLIIGTVIAIGAMIFSTLVIFALINRAQRSAQAALEAEDLFRLVMNAVNDGVYDFNPVHQTIYYSPTFKSMLGYADEEFPDTLQSFNDILHPEDVDATWETFHQYEKKQISDYRNIFRLRHKNGSWRWILSRGMGFWDRQGNLYRMVGTHMDITEGMKREEDLAQVNTDLETFTYIASHDLRSPLVNLKGFAKELAHAVERMKPIMHSVLPSLSAQDQTIVQDALEQDIPEALKFIEKSTERMDTLTTAVLDLSRIGKREYKAQTVDVEAIIHKCIGAQAYEIEQKKVKVVCDKLPKIVSDPLALEQIFSNLLDNAVKYLDPNRHGKIIISAREMATDVIFSVTDNGRGIEPQDQTRVFEMFRRARNAEDVRGVGMGMAFVRATLRKLGGSIWCESVCGVGTSFFVRLPKQPQLNKPEKGIAT
jgi:PAS domain S-box-containing protein